MTTTSPSQRLGVDIEQHGRVLVARLMGGPKGEFGPEIAADLDALVTRAETDDGVGAVVITGSHPGRFVAHAELRWLQEGGAASPSVGARGGAALVRAADTARRVPGVRELVDRTPLSGAMELLALHETFLRMNRCGTVFIAALNGSALGLGSELALACDYRLMALSLEDGLHLENAEFLSTLASPGAQAAMLAYMERTDQTGDLPLYDPPTYERTLAAGRFSGGKD